MSLDFRPTRRGILLGFGSAALLAATGASGCVARGRGVVVVDTAPPPPRRVVVRPREGHVWIHGHWAWVGGQWVWRDGYWVRQRPGRVYVRGRWVRRNGRYHWVRGYWKKGRRRGRRGVRERDHRGRRETVPSKRGRKRK